MLGPVFKSQLGRLAEEIQMLSNSASNNCHTFLRTGGPSSSCRRATGRSSSYQATTNSVGPLAPPTMLMLIAEPLPRTVVDTAPF